MSGLIPRWRQLHAQPLLDRVPAIVVKSLGQGSADSSLARRRVTLAYLWRHRRLPDLGSAPRFTELVQRRKLYDRDPRQIVLMDKLAAKQLAADALGSDWITPTLWEAQILPPAARLQVPSIIKARHGCNQFAVLQSKPAPAAWAALRRRSARWMAGPYGTWLDEWAYASVARALIAEPLVGDASVLPLDYKVYVFGGQATHVQVHLDRGFDHRWVLHDRTFRPLVAGSDRPAPPRSLNAMLEAAEILAQGFDFLRVDFYDIDGAARFGEFCLYPGSGLDPFAEDWIDFELGGLWHDAAATRQYLH